VVCPNRSCLRLHSTFNEEIYCAQFEFEGRLKVICFSSDFCIEIFNFKFSFSIENGWPTASKILWLEIWTEVIHHADDSSSEDGKWHDMTRHWLNAFVYSQLLHMLYIFALSLFCRCVQMLPVYKWALFVCAIIDRVLCRVSFHCALLDSHVLLLSKRVFVIESVTDVRRFRLDSQGQYFLDQRLRT